MDLMAGVYEICMPNKRRFAASIVLLAMGCHTPSLVLLARSGVYTGTCQLTTVFLVKGGTYHPVFFFTHLNEIADIHCSMSDSVEFFFTGLSLHII